MDAISRKEFIQACTALGLGATFAEEALAAPSSRRRGKVIIVGAGAAGLTAAYMLKRQKVKVRILEASNTIGGRLRKLEGFADFPIDLGGEWIHVHPRILKRIVDNNRVKINSPTVKYEIGSYFEWDGQAMQEYPAAPFFPTDYKFVRSTWIDFLNTYITPRVRRDIRLNRPVRSIRYSDDSVRVTTKDGKVETADKIIVTASLAMLQSRTIKF
ncbi:MAG: FAD-dependent oxidoreductase, partial [Verrucomicrobiota bacterium]